MQKGGFEASFNSASTPGLGQGPCVQQWEPVFRAGLAVLGSPEGDLSTPGVALVRWSVHCGLLLVESMIPISAPSCQGFE